MVGDFWEIFPCLKRGKNLTFNEIAELMYQPDLRSVQLCRLQAMQENSGLSCVSQTESGFLLLEVENTQT